MKRVCLCIAAALALCACASGMKSAVKDGKIAPEFNDTLVDSEYLWVRGFGAANPDHKTESQRRIMSREAAIAHAYQRAIEVLYGANLDADMQVVDAVSSGSTIHSSAEGLVNGMELVSTEYLADDGCAVIMRLPRQRIREAGINLKENN